MELPYVHTGQGQTVYETFGPPAYKTDQAAGFDLRACIEEPVTVRPIHMVAHPAVVPLGIAVAIPAGYEMQLRPRSSLGGTWGVTLANSPGTIDPDYRGEVEARLVGQAPEPVVIRPGDRVVQAVIAPVAQATPTLVDDLDETERGTGGFGVTGVQ